MRHGGAGSLAIAIALVWLIAVAGTTVIAYSTAWPVALFTGGDSVVGWGLGFLGGALVLGAWAARTTRSIAMQHVASGDRFRAPWPSHARAVELEALGLLDRRGQPGARASSAGDVLADLRRGERSERSFTIGAPVLLHVALDGPADAVAAIVDVEREHLVELGAARRHATASLAPGAYRVVLERRAVDEDARRATVHAWWLGTEPGTSAP